MPAGCPCGPATSARRFRPSETELRLPGFLVLAIATAQELPHQLSTLLVVQCPPFEIGLRPRLLSPTGLRGKTPAEHRLLLLRPQRGIKRALPRLTLAQ